MIENTGIDLSALNQISDVEIDNNFTIVDEPRRSGHSRRCK